MSIQRYEIQGRDAWRIAGLHEIESPYGPWVKHSDAASLLAQRDAEIARLRDALESRDLMNETLQRALGPDKVLEAFGFDRERIENARRQLAEGKFVTLEQLKAELAARREG